MKKLLAIAAVLSLSAAAVYGGDLNSTSWTAPTSGAFTLGAATGGSQKLVVKPSANVYMAYMGGASPTAGTTYSLGTFHTAGSKLFGSSSVETNIFYYDKGVAIGATTSVTPVIPTATSIAVGAFTAGWTASK